MAAAPSTPTAWTTTSRVRFSLLRAWASRWGALSWHQEFNKAIVRSLFPASQPCGKNILETRFFYKKHFPMWTIYILPSHSLWQLHSLKILEYLFNVVSPCCEGYFSCVPPRPASLPPAPKSWFSASTPTFRWQCLLNSVLEYIPFKPTPQGEETT